MRHTFNVLKTAWLVAILAITSTVSLAQNSPSEFFARDKSHNWTGPLTSDNYVFGSMPVVIRALTIPKNRQWVAKIVERDARRILGAKWVPTALKLAKIESNYNPRARNRSGASGVLQVMPASARAMGMNPRRLLEPEYGVLAGIEHMKRCIAAGVKTHSQMAACHVAGWAGWNRKLARGAEKYKQHYVRLAGGRQYASNSRRVHVAKHKRYTARRYAKSKYTRKHRYAYRYKRQYRG